MCPAIPDALELRRARTDAIARLTGRCVQRVRVGHYEMLSLLGTGGFGTVWEARDLRLGRTVALKRLREDVEEQWRLRLEARVLAQLDHPNVVKVFEVFEHDGSVFAVFEHVRGQTLARWLREPRHTEEVDAVFVQAAHGLAAVHTAGLAHGDFKPSNVIVTPDLRVKLLDFGLSGPVGVPTDRRGGTPAYMAPELRRAEAPTQAADQYALCLAWLEALELAPSTSAWRTAFAPRKVRVLHRGLHDDPSKRWSSIDELLRHLGAGARRGAVPLVALGSLAVLATLCIPSESRLLGCEDDMPWPARDPKRMARLFEEVVPGHGGRVAARVNESLAAWAPRWQEAWLANCQAATPAARHATATCLIDQRTRVLALVETFRQPTRAVVHSAAAAAHSLPRPTDCQTSAGTPFELHPDLANRMYATLHDALALARTGEDELAERLLLGLVREAEAVGWISLQAEATLELADLRHAARHDRDALSLTEQAYFLAREAGALAVSRRAAAQMTAYHAQKFDEQSARRWAALALALDDPEHVPGSLRAFLSNALGVLEGASGSVEQARRHFEQALEQLAADPVPSPRIHSAVLANLAEIERQLERPVQALATAETALRIHEDAFGPEDRQIVGLLLNAGRSAMFAGELEHARMRLERAVRFAQAHLRPEHTFVSVSHLFLADVLVEQQAWSEARPHAQAALDGLLHEQGPDDPRVEGAYRTLARILEHTGDLEEAERLAIRATELARQALGPDNPARVEGLIQLGRIRFARGGCDLGAAAYDEALGILERSGRSLESVGARVEEEATCRGS